jgi:hypothetical protein
MQVHVRTLDDETFTLEVGSSDDVETLKLKIEEIEGTYVKRQTLIFNGLKLEEGRTLEAYCINNESTIHFVRQLFGGGEPFKTFFVTTGRSDDPRFVTVELFHTVEELKRKVEDKFGIPASQRHLLFNGMKLEDG